MAEHVAAGDRSFVDEEYEEAIKHYTKALESAPSSSAYEARANAYVQLEKYIEAVQDAGKAIELDGKNAKAYLRKGTACFYLEEYETALQCFQEGQQLVPGDKKFEKWIHKCKAELDDEGGEQPAAQPTATPAAPAATAVAGAAPAQPAPAASSASAPAAAATSATAAAAAAVPAANQPLAPAAAATEVHTGKYRHQWYQLGPKVTIDIYAKNQQQDAVTAVLSNDDSHLKITIAAGSSSSSAAADQQQHQPEEDYVLELDLFGKVQSDIKIEVLRTKIEVTLTKAQPNQLWASLEKGAKGPTAAGVGAASPAAAGDPAAAARLYPSSKGPKDWSKVEAEVKQLEEKGELEDGDPLNSFFKKIFAGGDDDTRRAMMKSFVESNGTVLSTNWKEVGAKKIDCTPPEGAELHKWSEQL